ncbi:and other transporter-domain-containing protein [Absidia repens]|uniref:And other transporter-domain-containing protein n=1 Tax=Absidia repens TaxID=90262 RepID=A0A1X2IDV0_9FUNG|nr:and other transporter-domain-containing protein [Absidia repens]
MPLITSQGRIYLICSYVSLGGFMYGYDSGVISSCLVMPAFVQKYQLGDYSSAASTAAVAVTLATAFLASFVSGFVADRLGRKRLFYIGTVLNVVGCIVEVAGPSLASFLIGRIITGLGLGIFSMLVPLYQSEIARPENRGRLITLYQVGSTLGMSIAYWISYGTYVQQPNDVVWSLPIAFQLVPGGLLLLGLHLIPESPRWLIYRNRYDEALDIMALLRSDGNKDDLSLQMEFTGVRQDVWFDKHYTRKSFLALWSTGTENNLTRTLLGMGIHIFTQLSGINAILFYLPHIMESSGVMDLSTAVLIGNGMVGTVNFLGTLPCFWFIDRWDRRRILVIGALSMAISMIVVAVLSGIYDDTPVTSSLHHYLGTPFTIMRGDNKAATYTMLVFLCIFIAFFALSWGAVGWIYPAEIYPQIIRANAMGVTTSTSYLFNLVVTLVAPLMFVVHRYYPETRGRSLEEINLIFSGALVNEVDDRLGAHHPATAAEALLHLEQIRYREKRERLATAPVEEAWAETTNEQHSPIAATVVRSLESNVTRPQTKSIESEKPTTDRRASLPRRPSTLATTRTKRSQQLPVTLPTLPSAIGAVSSAVDQALPIRNTTPSHQRSSISDQHDST